MSTHPITLVRTGLKSRRELLWLKEGKRCHWCGCPTRLVDGDDWDQATTEHIIPRYKGGTNDEENLTSSCRRCNNRRSHEDACGLPDGHLLGKYKMPGQKHVKAKKYVALTKDDKRALLDNSGTALIKKADVDLIKMQRDQALKAVVELRGELKVRDEVLESLNRQLKSMTVTDLIRRKFATWLLTEGKK
jgi:5-methylcytosine-specific restriction endonuclease McrA